MDAAENQRLVRGQKDRSDISTVLRTLGFTLDSFQTGLRGSQVSAAATC